MSVSHAYMPLNLKRRVYMFVTKVHCIHLFPLCMKGILSRNIWKPKTNRLWFKTPSPFKKVKLYQTTPFGMFICEVTSFYRLQSWKPSPLILLFPLVRQFYVVLQNQISTPKRSRTPSIPQKPRQPP